MKQKYIIILDILCYGVIPYVIWNYGREPLGDYWAILLSTVPGIIYTVYRFIRERQFNIMGLFILGSLLLGTTVNLLSSSAETMLWNQIYLSLFFTSLHLLSILFKKPLALFFMVDVAFVQGYPRENSKALYYEKGLFIWFQLVTALFVLRGLVQSGLKAWLLTKYGADGYGQMIIYMTISGWVFAALIWGGFIFTGMKILKHVKEVYGVDVKPPNRESNP